VPSHVTFDTVLDAWLFHLNGMAIVVTLTVPAGGRRRAAGGGRAGVAHHPGRSRRLLVTAEQAADGCPAAGDGGPDHGYLGGAASSPE
jgi:hypothetical protein